ncbi:MAG TPA: fumarylacetoacetate hydrolase family protein [Candidatus Bathyarchaeia archaeon]|nr:fumarylacetoacetate hydrolase family protein [Candidatus Bathyarchaeia archaeon]
MTVRLANARGRASLIVGDRLIDVERASRGKFGADPMAALADWAAFVAWARGVKESPDGAPVNESDLGPPVPRPQKVFGIGMNYREHAKEAGLDIPTSPVVFTKFPSCLVGPRADVILSSGYVDWEVELVAVIGRRGRRIPVGHALDHVAGYTAGQDISDRKLQFADKPPQFSMGKSIDTFGPIGPALVSLDAFADPNDLALRCDVSGEQVQGARTSDMIFSVSELVAFLSSLCTLEPGDLIFTGTPSGVGSTRTPRRYLKPGEVITSAVEGIGTLVNRCVPEPS